MATGGPPHNPYGPPPGAPPHGPPPGAPNPYAAPPGVAPPGAAKPFDPKMAAYVLGGCAIAILIGVFTKSWMTGRDGAAGVGPLGLEMCFGGACRSVGWQGASASFSLPGYLALLGGLGAAGAAGWMAFLVLTSTPPRWPPFKIVNGVIGFAAFATTFFAIRLIIEGKELSISWSPIFAIGGVVTAGIFIRKLRPYWPGQGNTPWPIAPRAPQGQLGAGQPYGQPAMGQAPYGAPNQPYGQPPYGAPQVHGAPPSAPPQGQPFGAPQGQPYGAPSSAPPAYGAPAYGAPSSAPPQAYGPASGPPGSAPMAAAPQSKTVMGAPAPQLAAILQQQQSARAAAAPAVAPPAPAAAAQFCPRCGQPLEYVAQYQRWFCRGCNQYA